MYLTLNQMGESKEQSNSVKNCYLQPSWGYRKTKDGQPGDGGRPKLWSKPTWVCKKIHYWIGWYGGGQVIGPFFYPVINGHCIMNSATHYE